MNPTTKKKENKPEDGQGISFVENGDRKFIPTFH